MKKILLLKSISDLEQAECSGYLKDKKIIVASYAALYKLSEQGIQATPIWDYATDTELMEAFTEGKKIIDKFWMPFFRERIGDAYYRLPIFDLIFFLDEALASQVYIKKIIEKEEPGEIFCFTYPHPRHCIEGEWECTVFDSMIKYMCKMRGISYRKFFKHNYKSNDGKLLKKLSAYLNYLLKYFLGITLWPYWYIYSLKYRNRLVLSFVSEREQKMRFQWFFDQLEQKSNLKILNLWRCTLQYIDIFNNGLVRQYLNKKRIKRKLQATRAEFYAYKKKTKLNLDILQNPFLEFHWDRLLFTYIKSKMLAKRRARKNNRLFKPTMMLISQAHQERTISLSIAFQNLGVKTIILPHATIPYNQKLLYNYHDYVLATGRFQSNKFINMGIKSENILEIDDNRYTLNNKKYDLEKFKINYNINKHKVITIITRNIQAGCGLFPKWEVKLSMEKTYRFLNACADLRQLGSDYKIIFKSHPGRDYYELYDQYKKLNIIHLITEPADEIIRISDLVIVVGPFTDALFDAIIQQKKIILCDCGIDNDIVTKIKDEIEVVADPTNLFEIVENIFTHNHIQLSNNKNLIDEFLKCNHRKPCDTQFTNWFS